jgi:hypothetical protein
LKILLIYKYNYHKRIFVELQNICLLFNFSTVFFSYFFLFITSHFKEEFSLSFNPSEIILHGCFRYQQEHSYLVITFWCSLALMASPIAQAEVHS